MGWGEVCDRALFVQRFPTEAPQHQGNPLAWHGKGFSLRTPGKRGGKNNSRITLNSLTNSSLIVPESPDILTLLMLRLLLFKAQER